MCIHSEKDSKLLEATISSYQTETFPNHSYTNSRQMLLTDMQRLIDKIKIKKTPLAFSIGHLFVF